MNGDSGLDREEFVVAVLALQARHQLRKMSVVRFELLARSDDLRQRLRDFPCVFVRANVGQCIKDIRQCRDPRCNRNGSADQLHRIALAIPALVMMARDLLRDVHLRHVRLREDVRARRRVRLHDLALARRQLAGLQQDRVRHDQLADVVQTCGQIDQEADIVLEPDLLA
jgi:hypothetical protein